MTNITCPNCKIQKNVSISNDYYYCVNCKWVGKLEYAKSNNQGEGEALSVHKSGQAGS